jgi:hypothetical protein
MDTVEMDEQGPRRSGRAEWTQAAGRVRMFLISYAPLFGILAIRFDGLGLRVACLALMVLGLADFGQMSIRVPERANDYQVTITSVEDTGGEVGGYLASYLLPFVTVASPSLRDIIGYSVYLLVALVIYIRSDLIRINPTFYLFGYRVLKVEYGQTGRQYLITRWEPPLNEPISVVDIAGVIMEKT